MPTVFQPVKLRCVVDGDDELVFAKIELVDELDSIISTMEYADITKHFNDLLKINEEANLYIEDEELKKDLAAGKLARYLGNSEQNQKLDILTTLLARYNHQSGNCKDDCIYCNPDLGTDSFPDFTFKLKNSTSEGTS